MGAVDRAGVSLLFVVARSPRGGPGLEAAQYYAAGVDPQFGEGSLGLLRYRPFARLGGLVRERGDARGAGAAFLLQRDQDHRRAGEAAEGGRRTLDDQWRLSRLADWRTRVAGRSARAAADAGGAGARPVAGGGGAFHR